ncbi:MAG: PH domain-containing protein [Bacteroidetes bacterium]|nr:PH domain-containing protein [Bacteroidota bacterium]
MRTPLQKGEKILLVTYSSWISLIVPVLVVLIGFLLSYFIGFINHYGWTAALAGLLYFIIKYYSWKAYIWVVTNYRVIDENGLLQHYAKESPLDKINNVSYDQGVWGRIFNYGHVEIQTAAQVGATDYYNVHHPKRLKDTITQAQADLSINKNQAQASQLASAINIHSSPTNVAAELEKLFELKQKGILSEEEYNKAKNKLLNS